MRSRATLLLAALVPVVLPLPGRAACPGAGGALPASFAYDVTSGRHVAEAVAVLPQPPAAVVPLAEAVLAEPTWTNLAAEGAVPEPVKLRAMLERGRLKEPRLEIDATPDAECPGATRVRARFSWSLGAMARMLGGDAKDIPALFALVARDEVIARALTTPERARALTGSAPGPGMTLVRVAPQSLVHSDAALATLVPRLEDMEKSKAADLGEVLAVFFDVQRSATAIGGFGALSRSGATPTLVSGPCEACRLGYDISVTPAPGGDGASIAVGLRRAMRPGE